ncbi:mitochondrial import inner membrane translocase subunit TIM23-1-like [Rhodamnia argentea]|uniref:Mitochondrial import inner membrane translocase subunit TIM23-1-like n=1 Tax=Rhodamnia argentea TaxID=178133 RepID=A0A8B8NUX0_9MYRT|nr:mitochondrial import inner membrane translocase subunit TIM23-1-like [Rhodamnia argentea]XP_030525639.1 mitochondrial import inner membrane translocase subunit TIM23-1-like [Rhodamnia argentea]
MSFRSSDRNSESPEHREQDRLYNPYKELQVPIQNLYKLPTSPEFLFAEESLHQRRSWGENLTFYTGIGYLSGSIAGASYGLVPGVKAIEPSDTIKLKVNRLLNASGHSGRTWGNRLGVIGLMYAGLESAIVAVRDEDDLWSSVGAGLGTGAIYRAARGVRSAAVAGAVGGLAAAAAVAGKHAVKRYLPI